MLIPERESAPGPGMIMIVEVMKVPDPEHFPGEHYNVASQAMRDR